MRTKTVQLRPYPLTLKVRLLLDPAESTGFQTCHGCAETARSQELLEIRVTLACYSKPAHSIFLTAVHEAVHVVQDMANLLGIDAFDVETQAYWVEYVTQQIVAFWQTSSQKRSRESGYKIIAKSNKKKK